MSASPVYGALRTTRGMVGVASAAALGGFLRGWRLGGHARTVTASGSKTNGPPGQWRSGREDRSALCCASMNAKQAVADFLLHHGHRSFCATCLARAVKARTVPPVARAVEDLGVTPGCRVEEGECCNCERTIVTIRGLWTGI
jgi:hypothetical protein